jgi:FkbM family methyltransferase
MTRPNQSSDSTDIELPLPNGLVCHLPSGANLRNTRITIWEIFEKGRYRHPGFELRETDTVVDIGANVGLFALWAAPQVPKGRVISVEPSSAGSILAGNIEANAVANVSVIRAAVGRSGSRLELRHYPGTDSMSHAVEFRFPTLVDLFMRRKPSTIVSVPMMSFAELLATANVAVVDYLKIDCEGGEYEIFGNMSAGDWKRVRRVALEFHEYSSTHHYRDLVAVLEHHGFTVEVVQTWWERFMKVGAIWAWRPQP